MLQYESPFGSWRIVRDDRREDEAIRELARASAEYVASIHPRPDPSLDEKVAMAWTDGTADREKFTKAYGDASVRIANQKDVKE
ncbi:hypothetical protein AWV80_23395 [Cupriavidus sp. UYMU48A]|nr:hypothetical protein AWV80_23395 [Cupriavidus sp. UYMU48A]